MKQSLKLGLLGLAACLLTNGPAYAVNPVQGLYAGIFLGPTYTPDHDFTFINPITGRSAKGQLSFDVFGNIGGQLGYRCGQFRVEGELFFNSNPYKQLELDGFIIKKGPTNKKLAAPAGLRMKGNTNTGAFMVNGFYDFFTAGGTSNFSPYLGAGIGYAYVKNNIKFYYDNVYIPGTNLSDNASAPAAQGIIGASYFLDDYTVFGLDYRYFTTKTIQRFDSRVNINSVNITFNGSF